MDEKTPGKTATPQGTGKTPSRTLYSVGMIRYRLCVKVDTGHENENTSKEKAEAELFYMLEKEQGLILIILPFIMMLMLLVVLLWYYFTLSVAPSGPLLSTPVVNLAGTAS